MSLTHLRWVLTIPAGWTGDVYIGPIYKNRMNKPRVAIGFDDGAYSSQWTLGAQYMRARHIPGYFAPAVVQIDAGGVTTAQLQTLHSEGWSIHNHTYNHVDLTTVDDDAGTAEILSAQRWLNSKGLIRGAATLVYPTGANNAHVQDLCQSLGFNHARTVRTATERTWDGFEQPMNISAINIGGTSLSTLKSHVDDAIKFGGTAVFYAHAIDGVSLTQATFEGLIDYVTRLRDSNIIEVLSLQGLIDSQKSLRKERV